MDYRIAFKEMPSSEALEDVIAAEVRQLEERCPRAVSCRVVVAQPHARGRKGYAVHVQLHFPHGPALNASSSDQGAPHKDAYLAVRKAFKAVQRLLRDTLERRRGWAEGHGLNFA